MTDTEESEAISDNEQSIGKLKTATFSHTEKELLLLLVKENLNIIEDKKTDFGTNERKKRAWVSLASKFNSQNTGGCLRSWQQLKKAWANSKRVAKKETVRYKKAVRKTGGGKKPKEMSTTTAKISQMIPNQMKPLDMDYDCDGDMNHDLAATDLDPSSNSIQLEAELVLVDHGGHDTQSAEDDVRKKDETPSTSRRGLLTATRSPRRRLYKDARSSIVDMEYEEHKIRMLILGEQLRTAQIQKEQELLKLKLLQGKTDSPEI